MDVNDYAGCLEERVIVDHHRERARSYVWTRPHFQPAFEHCYPVASMYKACSRKPERLLADIG